MSKKAARILALIAFVALFNPGRNFLSLLDLACGLATKWRFSPLRCLHGFFLLYGCRTLAFWSSFVLVALLDLLLVRALYRYLAVRDFQKVCSDCAARPVRAWTLFALFAAFSFFQVRVGASTLDVSIPEDEHVPAGFEPGEGPSGPVYFVQEGDTFDGLAVLFGIPADRLREINGLAPDATSNPDKCFFCRHLPRFPESPQTRAFPPRRKRRIDNTQRPHASRRQAGVGTAGATPRWSSTLRSFQFFPALSAPPCDFRLE